MSDLNLEVFVEGSGDSVSAYVCGNDASGRGWACPVVSYIEDPSYAVLSPEQLTVWSAQLRMVAQQLQDLAEEFPPTGRKSEAN